MSVISAEVNSALAITGAHRSLPQSPIHRWRPGLGEKKVAGNIGVNGVGTPKPELSWD